MLKLRMLLTELDIVGIVYLHLLDESAVSLVYCCNMILGCLFAANTCLSIHHHLYGLGSSLIHRFILQVIMRFSLYNFHLCS